jgi:hypothetical protein
MTDLPAFQRELETLINRFSGENESNTPDFILAEFLVKCLVTWNASVARREVWYGRAIGTLGMPPLTDDPQ